MNQETPAISVIVPMFNVVKYIGFCLDSLFSQTFKDYEIILIDDASEDGTYELCQKICGQNKAVTLLKNDTNSGQCCCRNRGLELARGKYIYFMDSDDELLPEALEIFYNKAEEEKAEVVHANMYFISYAEGQMLMRLSMWELHRCEDISEGLLEGTKVERMSIQSGKKMPMPWLKLIRRDFLLKEKISFPYLKIREDDLFSTEVALKAGRFVCMNEPVYIYRKYYGEKDRVIKRLPQAIQLMTKALAAYNDLFSQFSCEEIPFSARLSTMTGWLRAHLNYWIYDILDTSREEDLLALKKSIANIEPPNCLQWELVPLLIHMLGSDSNIKRIAAKAMNRERERLEKYLAKEESSESGLDYARIYSLARRETLLEGCEDEFYLRACMRMARAAFRLGRHEEAWQVYSKALTYAEAEGEEEKCILDEQSRIRPYLECEEALFGVPGEDVNATSAAIQATFGVFAPYFSLTEAMLSIWQNLMVELPGASLVLVCEDFAAKPMMAEAAERLLFLGFDPDRVTFRAALPYQAVDIMLDTYPVSQGKTILEALSQGTPVVTLCGQGMAKRTGKEFLASVGLEVLAATSGSEYLAKAKALAYDKDFLHIMRKKLPQMVRNGQ